MSARRHHAADCTACPPSPLLADTARMPALAGTVRRRPPATVLEVRELHGADLTRALLEQLLADLAGDES